MRYPLGGRVPPQETGELKDYEKVFLFATQPAHEGLHAAGSETPRS